MGLLLVIPILVSGFIGCLFIPKYKFRMYRYEGQYLYIHCATLGTFYLLLAFLISFIWHTISPLTCYFKILSAPLQESGIFESHQEAMQFVWGVFILLISCSLPFVKNRISWLDTAIYNLRHRKQPSFKKLHWITPVIASVSKESNIDYLLFTALSEGLNIMLTLEDRKVYIGIVATVAPNHAHKGLWDEILLIPTESGYRDKNTLEVIKTTKYDRISCNIQIKYNLGVIIKRSQITSARYYSKDTFDQFQTHPPTNTNNQQAEVPDFIQKLFDFFKL